MANHFSLLSSLAPKWPPRSLGVDSISKLHMAEANAFPCLSNGHDIQLEINMPQELTLDLTPPASLPGRHVLLVNTQVGQCATGLFLHSRVVGVLLHGRDDHLVTTHTASSSRQSE